MRYEFSVRTLRHASDLLNGNDCVKALDPHHHFEVHEGVPSDEESDHTECYVVAMPKGSDWSKDDWYVVPIPGGHGWVAACAKFKGVTMADALRDCAFTALFYARRDGNPEYDLDVAYSWERAELAYDESRC